MDRHPRQGEIFFWPDVPENHPMGTKRRRWVVVSCDPYNRHSESVLACPVTSHPPDLLDIAIPKTPHNRLDHDSAMEANLITPILKEELGAPVGRVTFEIIAQVVDRMTMIVFGK